MKSLKKQRLRLPLMLVWLAGLTAACGTNGGAGDDAGTPPPSGTSETDLTQKPAEIVFYSDNGDSVESFDRRFGDALRKRFPNWTIRYIQKAGAGTTLDELVASATNFDIYFQSIGNYEAKAFSAGIQYDMTDLLQTHKIDLNRLDPTVVEAVKQASGGKLYGLPVFTNDLVLYYNKTVFDKFGAAYPKDGMTWSETNELSKKLTRTDSGVTYFGFTYSPNHMLRLNPLSIPNADLTNDTPTINRDPLWKTYFQTFYLDLLRAPGYLDGMTKLKKIPDLSLFVKDQTVGMFAYLSSFVYVNEQELKGVNWDMAALPTFEDRKGIGSQSYPSYFGITNMSRNKEAAMEVLSYMVSDEFQGGLARQGTMPVLQNEAIRKELGKSSPFPDRHWDALFYNKFAPIPPKAGYDSDLVSQYNMFGTQLALDKMDLNTALRSAEEGSLKKIQAYNSKSR